MTLEKLLIFGFGLAVVFALTTVSINMVDDRKPKNTKYESGVKTMLQKMR